MSSPSANGPYCYGVSSTVRKFATLLCLFGTWYVFHFDRRMKSIKSWGFRFRCCSIRKVTYRESTHRTAPLRCGGHRRKCRRSSHSSGIFAGVVRSILAVMFFVCFYVDFPSSHSVKRWLVVSFLPHSLQMSVGDILIRYNLSFVGMVSCITLYQVAMSVSVIGAALKFFQIVFQSALGHNLTIRISCGGASAAASVFSVV